MISTNDNTNSLHANACDEAITTPTEESVRYCSLGQITNALFEVGGSTAGVVSRPAAADQGDLPPLEP